MKPKKITREKWNAIYDALVDKATQLAEQEGAVAGSAEFFSGAAVPCALVESSANFPTKPKAGVHANFHFLPFPCSCKERTTTNADAICLTKHGEACYITTHKIGKCPWKEVRQ